MTPNPLAFQESQHNPRDIYAGSLPSVCNKLTEEKFCGLLHNGPSTIQIFGGKLARCNVVCVSFKENRIPALQLLELGSVIETGFREINGQPPKHLLQFLTAQHRRIGLRI